MILVCPHHLCFQASELRVLCPSQFKLSPPRMCCAPPLCVPPPCLSLTFGKQADVGQKRRTSEMCSEPVTFLNTFDSTLDCAESRSTISIILEWVQFKIKINSSMFSPNTTWSMGELDNDWLIPSRDTFDLSPKPSIPIKSNSVWLRDRR